MSFNIAKLLGLNRPIESESPVKCEQAADRGEIVAAPAPPPCRPMRLLAELYQPGEQFEISRAGLLSWRASPAFERVFSFYRKYPEDSLQSDEARALLHHLIVMHRPERLLEIGTWHAGTTETMARALWETRQGQIDTIDPFGGDRCPPIIASFPPELRELVAFRAENSATYFDRAITKNIYYDFVLVDGNHEYEFALFDVMCAARTIRPGGLIVMDNIEQIGPRLAAKTFLERNPDWRDVADVVRHIDLTAPFKVPAASFADTKFYVLQAPPHYIIRDEPRIFGPTEVDRAVVNGIELELATPVQGRLHILVYVRTFNIAEPEELSCEQSLDLDAALPANGNLRIPLSRPLHTAFPEPGLIRRVEVSLAFNGSAGLALRSAPRFYPANYGRSLGVP